MALPPLGLEAVVSSPSGGEATTLNEYTTDPRKLAKFGPVTTKVNTGFEGASLSTDRDQRLTYGTPRLMQELKVRGAGNWSVFEGRVTGVPVGRNDNVQASGWWDGLKDTSGVAEVYIDSDVSKWGEPPTNEKARILAANIELSSLSWSNENGQLVCSYPAQALPAQCTASAWYQAPPGVTISSVLYTGAESSPGPTSYLGPRMYFLPTDSDTGVTAVTLTLDSTERTATPADGVATRYVAVNVYSNGSATTPTAGMYRKYTSLKAIGNHGLSNTYASEVIKHAIGKYCPLLTATDSTIDATSYAIGHLVFDGATAADVVQQVNAFHLWRFAVWNDRTCYFAPQRDLTDYDYEIPYQGEYRGTLDPAGPSMEDDEPCNGVWVYYTDVQTQRRERVGPYGTASPYDTAGDTSLLVTSEINACSIEGQIRFPPLELSRPCTRADAILMGSVWLAEKQTKVNAGTGKANGYVKNRAGAWVPAYQIRAGDRVRYSHETNTIREVYSTSYEPAEFTNSLTFEKPDSTYEGINERVQVSLQAALGS